MEKINFVFLGRLEEEKGFDLVISLIEKLKENKLLDKTNIFIFGTGKLELNFFYKFPDLIEYVSNKPKNNSPIKFFSWVEKSMIENYLEKSHYCIMPSRFLETFGLSALEAVNYKIPVIGFKKGGLQQFILDDLDIYQAQGKTNLDKLYNIVYFIITDFDKENYSNQKKKSYSIANKYTFYNRYQKITELINNRKNILMISDYTSNLGGIEGYIYNISSKLEEKNFETDFIGSGIKSSITRKLCLPMTAFNFIYYFGIKGYIRNNQPDVIWFHSVSRFLGWMPLMGMKNFRGKKLFMYHDLGYFHPFPSQVTKEEQILQFSLKNFIKSGNTKNPIIILLIILKYFSNKTIRSFLIKYFDVHLVPSEFMINILKKWGIPEEKIVILPHYK